MDTNYSVEDQLNEFNKHIGDDFFFIGDGKDWKAKVQDEIVGVNNELQTVVGVKGEYPVEWCRLKEDQPQGFKKHIQQLSLL